MSAEMPQTDRPYFHIGWLQALAREMAREYPKAKQPAQMLNRLDALAEALRDWQKKPEASNGV